MKKFIMNENGNMTVSFSLLTPFIIFYFLWVVSTWQANYIQLQIKSVLDLATLGGASTGISEKAGSSIGGSYIPIVGGDYGSEVSEYGADVAKHLLEMNAYNTLPKSVADQLVSQTKDFWSSKEEIDYQNAGIMHVKVENIKYRTLVPVLTENWNFTIESSAVCQLK